MNAMTRAALRSLIKQIGLFNSLNLAVGIALDQMRGLPFKSLPQASDRNDRESRRQLAPAILVYQRLGRQYNQAKALEITRQVVISSGRAFLSTVLKSLDHLQGPRLH